MSNINLTFVGPSGDTFLGTIERLSDNFYRRDSNNTFAAGLSFNQKSTYLPEGSAENLGSYFTSVEASGWSDGQYLFRVHSSGGSNYTIANSLFSVRDGSEVTIGQESTIFDIYHADIKYTLDVGNNRDEYTVIWYKNGIKLDSGVSAPTIQVIDRGTGSDLIASSAMSEVGATHIFIYNATGAEKQTLGEAHIVIVKATIDSIQHTFVRILGRDKRTS